MTRFERWCARHNKYGIRNLMLFIIIGNIATFILMSTEYGLAFVAEWLLFVPSLIAKGQVWRLITFIFIDITGNIFSLALSCIFYFFVGRMLENEWGRLKFTVYYLSGVVLHSVFGLVASIWHGDYVAGMLIGSHYLNMSLFLAYATLEPNAYLRLYFIIPVKAKWLAIIDAAYIAAGLFLNSFPANLLPLVVLLNYVVFFAPRIVKTLVTNKRTRSRRIDFEKKAQEYKKRGYTHRCVVCGKTDESHPGVEFRYCPRCKNYSCYCEEHILDHTHVE